MTTSSATSVFMTVDQMDNKEHSCATTIDYSSIRAKVSSFNKSDSKFHLDLKTLKFVSYVFF